MCGVTIQAQPASRVGSIGASGARMTMKACPACEKPDVIVWRLLLLGGLHRAICGARTRLSDLGSFALLALGTWIPVTCAIVGGMVTTQVSAKYWPFGGVVGLALGGTVFSRSSFAAPSWSSLRLASARRIIQAEPAWRAGIVLS